jgi:hypothetical protein
MLIRVDSPPQMARLSSTIEILVDSSTNFPDTMSQRSTRSLGTLIPHGRCGQAVRMTERSESGKGVAQRKKEKYRVRSPRGGIDFAVCLNPETTYPSRARPCVDFISVAIPPTRLSLFFALLLHFVRPSLDFRFSP